MGLFRRLRGGRSVDGQRAVMGQLSLYADGHAETGDGIFWAEASTSPSGR